MIDIHIEDVTGTTIPVVIEGEDTGGCGIVLDYPTNSQKYAGITADSGSELISAMFLDCVHTIDKPFKINGKEIIAEDVIKYSVFAETFDECVKWLNEAMSAPAKN